FAANAGRINASGTPTITACNTACEAQNDSDLVINGTVSSCTTGIYASYMSRIMATAATVSSCTTGCKVDVSSLIAAVGITNSGNTANFSQTVNTVNSSGCINN